MTKQERRLPVGAEVLPGGGVSFRVWAVGHRRVEVVIEGDPGVGTTAELAAEEEGYFSGIVPQAAAGSLYRFRLDGDQAFPDPASRFQPEGPHGPSQVIDPRGFPWTDHDWRGITLPGQVLYELHLGTFTPEGTWEAAARRLPELAQLGITAVEVMPVADFVGSFGWGYDGVDMYAPCRLYGSPDDMRRFVDAAHRLGLAVLLDVVYNHLGPDGNYTGAFSKHYVSEKHKTDWGDALNFDGTNSGPVRDFFTCNGAYWIDEFHIDGLRLDATQNIYDDSSDHVLALLTRRCRAAAGQRNVVIIAENDIQQMRLVRPPEKGGYGLDGTWNDDFHHCMHVALTGQREFYYLDFRGSPQEIISLFKYGQLYCGQYYAWEKHGRGTPSFDIPPHVFVNFIQNHDQIAHSAFGLRYHQRTSPGRGRALTALLLLSPGTPMLFQGQEFSCSRPFLFFADHPEPLVPLVRKGRREFLAHFNTLATPEMQERLDPPAERSTFERCKIDWSERERNQAALALHADLLKLRRADPVFSAQRPDAVDGAVLTAAAFVLRFFAPDGDDRLIVVNLGHQTRLDVVPEPLLAPPLGKHWRTVWSSEDPRYGGHGTPPVETDEGWFLPGEVAVVLRSEG
jgi:maltooligosyltrehalose trehalohydrolase